jgi:hypothetical protein
MTKDDIIQMAREALKEDDGEDYYAYTHQIIHWWGKEDEIIKFAELVAAAEREACAKFLLSTDLSGLKSNPEWQNFIANLLANYAAAIRARGQS